MLVDGKVVEGARVVFTVNSGNLVAVETENLPELPATPPPTRVSVEQARSALAAYIGGFEPGDEMVDDGSYHLLPANRLRPAEDGRIEAVAGRELAAVWEFVFRRPDTVGTWRARVDVVSGRVEDFGDVNHYGAINGGVAKTDGLPADLVLPMPYANYGAGIFSNPGGIFPGNAGTTSLNGQFVRIVDSCGAVSRGADASGRILLGGSATGNDCVTPGVGGAGNTRSARTQFFHLNRASDMAWGWLPTNPWLLSQLTANTNINQVCNAFWDGSTVNFFRSGGGCGNTGQIPAVSIHEWGHGLDDNDGDPALYDFGTGETYGDFTAALVLHSSCVGGGFQGGNCGGYGNPCTTCSGVRDIDYGRHSANLPATVGNHTYPRCPLVGAPSFYVGPCGLDRLIRGLPSGDEGHCESQVSSEALWDLVNRDLAPAGSNGSWLVADRLWFLSRSTARGAFQCNSAVVPYTANGCNAGSLFRVMRTIDDDNGNLNDGTPHGAAIGAAFNRHGIACASLPGWNTTRVAVARPAVPALAATTPVPNQVALSWGGSSGRYDVFRNELGCSFGFQRIANDVNATALVDGGVAGGTTYYYQVSAQPVGNEAASSAPSNCVAVTPTSPIPSGPCVPSPTTLCLNANRFRATVNFRTATGSGTGQAIPFTSSSGFYWFFSADNIELMLKVLNGCPSNNRYWVFHAATTNVEYTLTVTDTATGQVKTYFNPLFRPAVTVLDANAFATCP